MRLNRLNKAMMLACATSLTLPVIAQEADVKTTKAEKKLAIERISVTAQKRIETQQETALTVNTFDGDALKKAGIFDFADLEKLSAGISIDGDSGHAANISIRGTGSQAISGLDASVAVFIDGVVQNNVGSAFSSLLDVARIEVLRGPQGTLYGKNAPSGAINIITNSPDSSEFNGNVEATISSFDTTEYKGTVNIPLVEDVLALRVSGLSTKSDGYIYNEHLEKPANGRDRQVARVKLGYTPTDDLAATLIVNHSESEVGNPLQLTGDNIYQFSSYENDQGSAIDNNDSVSLEINWGFDASELTFITSYQDYDLTGDRDNDFSPAAIGAGGSIITLSQSVRSVTHELRLTSDDSDTMEYMVGLFYSDQSQKGSSIFDNGGYKQDLTGEDVTKSFGVFSNNTYFFDDEWSLAFGVRYSEDKKDTVNSQVTNTGTTSGQDADTFDNLSGSLKLRYMPNYNETYYVSVDRAYRAGGFNVLAPQSYKDEGFGEYDSELSHAIEFGAKLLLWDERFQLNSAIFYQTFEDYQLNSFLNDQAMATPWGLFVIPAGNIKLNGEGAVAKGAEVEFTALVNENFTVSGTVAYNRVELDALDKAPTTFANAGYATYSPQPGLNLVVDPRVIADPTIVPTTSRSGEVLKGNPQLTASLVLEYKDSISDKPLDWFVRASTKYNSDRNYRVLGAYNSSDFSAGIVSQDGTWNVTVFAKNITDEQYLVFGNDAETSGLGFDVGMPGAPRSYGVTVGYRF